MSSTVRYPNETIILNRDPTKFQYATAGFAGDGGSLKVYKIKLCNFNINISRAVGEITTRLLNDSELKNI